MFRRPCSGDLVSTLRCSAWRFGLVGGLQFLDINPWFRGEHDYLTRSSLQRPASSWIVASGTRQLPPNGSQLPFLQPTPDSASWWPGSYQRMARAGMGCARKALHSWTAPRLGPVRTCSRSFTPRRWLGKNACSNATGWQTVRLKFLRCLASHWIQTVSASWSGVIQIPASSGGSRLGWLAICSRHPWCWRSCRAGYAGSSLAIHGGLVTSLGSPGTSHFNCAIES